MQFNKLTFSYGEMVAEPALWKYESTQSMVIYFLRSSVCDIVHQLIGTKEPVLRPEAPTPRTEMGSDPGSAFSAASTLGKPLPDTLHPLSWSMPGKADAIDYAPSVDGISYTVTFPLVLLHGKAALSQSENAQAGMWVEAQPNEPCLSRRPPSQHHPHLISCPSPAQTLCPILCWRRTSKEWAFALDEVSAHLHHQYALKFSEFLKHINQKSLQDPHPPQAASKWPDWDEVVSTVILRN